MLTKHLADWGGARTTLAGEIGFTFSTATHKYLGTPISLIFGILMWARKSPISSIRLQHRVSENLNRSYYDLDRCWIALTRTLIEIGVPLCGGVLELAGSRFRIASLGPGPCWQIVFFSCLNLTFFALSWSSFDAPSCSWRSGQGPWNASSLECMHDHQDTFYEISSLVLLRFSWRLCTCICYMCIYF